MKTSELGVFWLKDNLHEARCLLEELQKYSNPASSGIYRDQMNLLLAARMEVVAVWEKHLKMAEEKKDG